MELEDYRRASHAVWERMASGWDERRDWLWASSRTIGEWMVAHLEPAPGQTVLELAAGTGETGFAAAALLGDEGQLISSDFSPQMVDAARRRAEELGLGNVSCRTLDAESLDLDDDSVDGVLCRWGYMLMGDPAAALAETRRVLRDGGRLALAVFAASDRNEWASLPVRVLVGQGAMAAPEPGAPGICALGDPTRLTGLVTGAGFADPEVEEVGLQWRFGNFDDYWYFLTRLAGAVAMALEALPEDRLATARAGIEEALAPYADADGGYALSGVCLCAVTS